MIRSVRQQKGRARNFAHGHRGEKSFDATRRLWGDAIEIVRVMNVEEAIPRIDNEVLSALRIGMAISSAEEKTFAAHESLDDVVVNVRSFPFVVSVEKIHFKNVLCFSKNDTVNVTIHLSFFQKIFFETLLEIILLLKFKIFGSFFENKKIMNISKKYFFFFSLSPKFIIN